LEAGASILPAPVLELGWAPVRALALALAPVLVLGWE
jgi:hypothetical protein